MRGPRTLKVFCLLMMSLGLLAPCPASGDVETLLAEVNQKPPDQRLKELVEGAKRERVIYYWGAADTMMSWHCLEK